MEGEKRKAENGFQTAEGKRVSDGAQKAGLRLGKGKDGKSAFAGMLLFWVRDLSFFLTKWSTPLMEKFHNYPFKISEARRSC